MKNEELLKQNTKLVRDAMSMKHTERTPVYANVYYWKILDAGYKMSEGLLNHEIMYKIEHDFQQKYNFDVCMGAGTMQRMLRALGYGDFVIDDEHESLSLKDHHYMEEDEYPALCENINKFTWEVMFKRFCNNGELDMENLKNALAEFMAVAEYSEKTAAMYTEEFCIPIESPNFYNCPSELFENGVRGLKGAGIDYRRHKSEVKDFFDKKFEATFPGYLYMLDNPYPYQISDGYTCLLSQNIMNVKQFEEFFWPYLKKVADATVERNGILWSYSEGKIDRFADFLNDIPAGHFATTVEQDDIFALRKICPHISLMGGLPVDLLGFASEQECVDYAKKLIDEIGDGFILAANKSLNYRRDGKSENLLAVNEFARSYKH